MVKSFIFVVNNADTGATLISYLASKLGISRKKAKALINTRMIFINSKRTWMANHNLSHKDKVEYKGDPYVSRDKVDSRISIIYKDDDYIIIDKPAGMISNGNSSAEEMLNRMKGFSGARAVHRLDKDTTGCLLFARNERAFEDAVKLFRNKEVRKSYHAIALGRPYHETMTIDTPIDGKRAKTHFKTFDSSRVACHLLVTIQTGRTHQIRKHLALNGLPIAGDRYYGPQGRKNKDAASLGRQMLHAFGLEFKSPVSGKVIRGKAPLPKDFRRCLKTFNLS